MCGLWRVPNILICGRDLPVRSVPELVALLKREPGRYAYAAAEPGTTPHLAMEFFKRVAGVDVAPVPDRGGAEAILDLLRGRMHVVVHNLPTAIVGVREREVRALAVTGAGRSPAVPEMPAMAEFYPEFEVASWGGLVRPAGLPPRVVERLSRLTRRALDSPDLADTSAGTAPSLGGRRRKTSRTSARGRRRCSPGWSRLRPRESISRPIAGAPWPRFASPRVGNAARGGGRRRHLRHRTAATDSLTTSRAVASASGLRPRLTPRSTQGRRRR